MKKFHLFTLLAIATCFGMTSNARAADLLTVYQQAVQNDPTFQGALDTRNATAEGVPISRASLLPTLGATAQSNFTQTNSPSANSPFNNVAAFNSHDYALSLSQPIFNLADWMALRSASATAKQADATYAAALQTLIINVSTAYFNVLQAQDTLTYTEAQKEALANQLKQIRARFDVGLATMTDVYQVQASYDAIVAAEITAKNAIINNEEALTAMTNNTYSHLATLRKSFPLVTPAPSNTNQWIQAADAHNWTVRAARYAMLASHETLRQNFSNNLPTVSATGSYQDGNNLGGGGSSSGSNASSTDSAWSTTVGVQVSFPIFSGGLTLAQTRQAEDNYAGANASLVLAQRTVDLQTEQSFNNVVAYASKVAADRVAITSAESALDATNEGFKVGTKTILDVLTAEQNLYSAQTTYAADEYTYILSTLQLKQAAGTLSVEDVQAINAWLEHQQKETTTEKAHVPKIKTYTMHKYDHVKKDVKKSVKKEIDAKNS